jgi:two-component system, chemotaxis family, chemotaxis protein CheY
LKFLVVDDSKIARSRICDYINKLGYEVLDEACDGIEAIEKYKKLLPSIITIDLEMPNMKGIEASKEILRLNPKINIILITSIIDKKEVINALKIGIKKVIQKPFTFEYFEQEINELKKGAFL